MPDVVAVNANRPASRLTRLSPEPATFTPKRSQETRANVSPPARFIFRAPCASGRRPNAFSTTPLKYTAAAPPPWAQRGRAVVRANPRALDPYHSLHRMLKVMHL